MKPPVDSYVLSHATTLQWPLLLSLILLAYVAFYWCRACSGGGQTIVFGRDGQTYINGYVVANSQGTQGCSSVDVYGSRVYIGGVRYTLKNGAWKAS